jgi:carbamoylphosphate synthase small subunit
VMSIQFHPEASPGPHDALGIFAEFFALIRGESPHPPFSNEVID